MADGSYTCLVGGQISDVALVNPLVDDTHPGLPNTAVASQVASAPQEGGRGILEQRALLPRPVAVYVERTVARHNLEVRACLGACIHHDSRHAPCIHSIEVVLLLTAANSLPALHRTLICMIHASTAYCLKQHSAFRNESLICALGSSVMLGQAQRSLPGCVPASPSAPAPAGRHALRRCCCMPSTQV